MTFEPVRISKFAIVSLPTPALKSMLRSTCLGGAYDLELSWARDEIARRLASERLVKNA